MGVKSILKRKRVKYLLFSVGVLLVLLVSVSIYLASIIHPLLTKVIKENIYESTDRLYRIDFSDIRVNLLTGNVVLNKITFRPDMNRYKQLKSDNNAPNNLFELDVDKLVLQRVKPIRVYFKRQLSINSVRIKSPKLIISYYHNKQKTKIKYNANPYLLISKVLKSLSIKNILLDDIDFIHRDYKKTGLQTTSIKNLSIGFENLFINEFSYQDTSKIFSSENVFLILKNYKYNIPNSIYSVYVGSLVASTKKKSLVITNLKFPPKINREAFFKTLKVQKDYYNISFGKVSLLNINTREFIDQRLLHASVLNLSNAQVNVFLNRDFPKSGIDKGVNYPHLALKRADVRLKIDTTKLYKVNISYGEYNPKTNENGAVYFTNLKGRILNISNDEEALSKNSTIDASLQTYLMGKGNLKVSMKFKMLAPKADFSFKGNLVNMEAKAINPVSRKLGLIAIKKGNINNLYFNMSGNLDGAGGFVKFLYQDLSIEILKKNDEDRFKKQGFMSMLANAIVIKDHNPEEGKPERSAQVYYKRAADASFFNLMWNSVFMGIKNNIGLTLKMQNNVKEKVKLFEKLKKDRLKRQKRREERKQNRLNNIK